MSITPSVAPPFKLAVVTSLVLPALLTLTWIGGDTIAAPVRYPVEKKSGLLPDATQRDKLSQGKTKNIFSTKKALPDSEDEKDEDEDRDEASADTASSQPDSLTLDTGIDPASLLVPMNGLMSSSLRSALYRAAEWTEIKSGYHSVSLTLHNEHYPKPERVKILKVLTKDTPNGLEVIRLGLFASSPEHPILWAQSFIKTDQAAKPANSHKALVNDIKAFVNTETQTPEVRLAELESEMIELSYADVDQAMYSLAAMGVSVFTGKKSGEGEEKSSKDKKPSSMFSFGSSSSKSKKSKKNDDDEEDAGAMSPNSIPKSVPFNQLPMVFKVPSLTPASTSMIAADGEGSSGKGEKSAFGATTISSAGKLNPSTVSSRANQLLVMYHPEHPESLSRVKRLLKQKVDIPARQIYIEGMVLEVSTTLLDQLGINFTRNSGTTTFTIGSATSGALNSLTYLRDSAAAVVDPRQLVDRLNALVRDGKAELLSRPSVLTLDNRQATIRVGTDIPIATSKSGASPDGYGDVSFSFEYIQTGIQLNIRPRIETESSEVSMTIDTTVSETVPGADLEIRNSTGDRVLAAAPTISSRSVQTYARLKNNTPLIIGGLVSKNLSTVKDSVPLIGKIPLIGDLLGYSSKNETKREVIIVLTPYVLSESNKLPRVVPKDSDEFDMGKTELFRESYRIRTEDVFDTRYLRTNARIRAYQALADKILLEQPNFKEKSLFSKFANGRIPGEKALVHGMYYNFLDRLNVGKNIGINDFTFYTTDSDGKIHKTNLEQVMKEHGDGQTYQSFFSKNPGKALALTFTYHRNSVEQGLIRTETMPVISLVECPDQDAWESTLQKMRGKNEEGLKYHTILIKDEADLKRLRLTQAVKRTVSVNDGDSTSTIDRFLTGRMIAIPVIGEDHEQLLEASVAELYYDTALHYKALEGAIDSVTKEIDTVLTRDDMQEYQRFLDNKKSKAK